MSVFESGILPQAARLPLFSAVADDLAEGGASAFLWLLAALIIVWIAAIALFGYPAIIIPALVAVPVIFTVLMLITVGK